jgi:hypothetical protein
MMIILNPGLHGRFRLANHERRFFLHRWLILRGGIFAGCFEAVRPADFQLSISATPSSAGMLLATVLKL